MADLNRLPLTYVYNGFINLTGGYLVAMINVTAIARRSFCRTGCRWCSAFSGTLPGLSCLFK